MSSPLLLHFLKIIVKLILHLKKNNALFSSLGNEDDLAIHWSGMRTLSLFSQGKQNAFYFGLQRLKFSPFNKYKSMLLYLISAAQ